MTLSELKTEIQRPTYVGLSDAAIAAKLNDKSGSEAAEIALLLMPKGDFLLAIAPVALALAAKPADVQTKWDRVLTLISGNPDSIRVNSAAIQGLLAVAVADGLITNQQVNQICKRLGSRAEVLWGDGAYVDEQKIGEARNS